MAAQALIAAAATYDDSAFMHVQIHADNLSLPTVAQRYRRCKPNDHQVV
jgi:hypothetical protein